MTKDVEIVYKDGRGSTSYFRVGRRLSSFLYIGQEHGHKIGWASYKVVEEAKSKKVPLTRECFKCLADNMGYGAKWVDDKWEDWKKWALENGIKVEE